MNAGYAPGLCVLLRGYARRVREVSAATPGSYAGEIPNRGPDSVGDAARAGQDELRANMAKPRVMVVSHHHAGPVAGLPAVRPLRSRQFSLRLPQLTENSLNFAVPGAPVCAVKNMPASRVVFAPVNVAVPTVVQVVPSAE